MRKGIRVIVLSLVLILRALFVHDISGEYVISQFPQDYLFNEMSLGVLFFYIIWNSPVIIITYYGLTSMTKFLQDNYIYFVTRNSSVQKSLFYILRVTTIDTIIYVSVAYTVVALFFFNRIALNMGLIVDLVLFLLFNIAIQVVLFLIYTFSFKEEIIAFYAFVQLLLMVVLTHNGWSNAVGVLLQASGLELICLLTYTPIILISIIVINRFSKLSNKLN